jgi:hypothetical protein
MVALIAYLLLKLTELTYLSTQTIYKISRLIDLNLMERLSIMNLLKPDKTTVEQIKFERLKI